MRDRHANVLSREERDRLITDLRQRNWTTSKIASAVGMTRQGVEAALRRLTNDPEGEDREYWDGWTLETRPLES